MSFSIRVKNEIINDKCEKTEMISLLSAYIRNNAVITEDAILINTENLEISKYIFKIKEPSEINITGINVIN